MDIWLTVLLTWLGVNIALVALMWRYETIKARHAGNIRRATAGSATAEGLYTTETGARDGTGPRPRRVVALTSADSAAAARAASATRVGGASHVCATTPMPSCRLHELHDEIRVLKLTVAELSLDKAMLSAAAARRKVSP